MTDPVVSPLLDAYGNPSLVTAGELIESAWGNAVVRRVVYQFQTAADMEASPLPHGTMAIVLTSHVVYLRLGVAWIPTAMGARAAFRCVGPVGGVPVGSGALATVVWDVTFDPMGVVGSGSTVVVPPGWDGRWVFEWGVEFPDGGQTGTRMAFCETSIGRLGETNNVAMEGGVRMAGSASAMLAVGQFARVVMYHTDTVILNVNSTGNQYFQGYYAGRY